MFPVAVAVCVGPCVPPCLTPPFASFGSCPAFCSGASPSEEGLAGELVWVGDMTELLAAGEAAIEVELLCSCLLVSFVEWFALEFPRLALEEEEASGVFGS